jgi:membrane protein YdbS with pleckstrin-like domain
MARCYYHPERESVGQCANSDCRVYLCRDCYISGKRGFCQDCTHVRKRGVSGNRTTAKIDIAIFLVCAVVGGSLAVLGFGLNSTNALYIAVMLFLCYGIGACLLGAKKAIGWAWRRLHENIIAFIILLPFAYVVGALIGIFVAPLILYRACRTLWG